MLSHINIYRVIIENNKSHYEGEVLYRFQLIMQGCFNDMLYKVHNTSKYVLYGIYWSHRSNMFGVINYICMYDIYIYTYCFVDACSWYIGSKENFYASVWQWKLFTAYWNSSNYPDQLARLTRTNARQVGFHLCVPYKLESIAAQCTTVRGSLHSMFLLQLPSDTMVSKWATYIL